MRRWPQGLEGDGQVIAGISWKESKEMEDSSCLDLNTLRYTSFTGGMASVKPNFLVINEQL